jgi:hypothetical protein
MTVRKNIVLAAAAAGTLALLSASAASAMPPTDRTLSVPSDVQQVQRRLASRLVSKLGPPTRLAPAWVAPLVNSDDADTRPA